MLTYLLLILGFVFLVKGADLLIDGASSIAKRLHVSDLFIGLTVVAFGTSAPELIINLISNFNGSADLAMGNIIGACIANILLIGGIAAMIYPIKVNKSTSWKSIPLGIVVIALFFFLVNDAMLRPAGESILSRFDGVILLLFFAIFIYYTFGINRLKGEENISFEKKTTYLSAVYILLGIGGLILGGNMVVKYAVEIARSFGLSEAMIGLTIISIGTTLPELTASAIAAFKKSADIAIGNIIGSTIFNISFILGISALIKPMIFNSLLNTDILIALSAIALLFYFALVGKKKKYIDRWEGIALFSAYLLYIVFLTWRG
ncbi:MAG TPA: calcium/sodium antiporter [Patescibacteria group bacterium]|nr:calcium/sodium antiporter [Patescibacteria group bacterium]